MGYITQSLWKILELFCSWENVTSVSDCKGLHRTTAQGSLAAAVGSWVHSATGWGLLGVHGLEEMPALFLHLISTSNTAWAEKYCTFSWRVPGDAWSLSKSTFPAKKGPNSSFLSDFKPKADKNHTLCILEGLSMSHTWRFCLGIRTNLTLNLLAWHSYYLTFQN